jgi:hypothetical protein
MTRYPSPAEIEEMRARGYDPATIDEAIRQSRRWAQKESLKATIAKAFAGVTLGDGVGLHEAQGLDGYETEEKCKARRAADEKLVWAAISAEALNECNSSLSFFDAEGMRFHLPAFLIADLDCKYRFGMAFSLTQSGSLGGQFALLNEAQCDAIRAFLEFIVDEPDYAFHREHIQYALDNFWAQQGAV